MPLRSKKAVVDKPAEAAKEEAQAEAPKKPIKPIKPINTVPAVDRKQVEGLIERATRHQGDAVTELFDAVMRFAHESRASDVHLEPEDEQATIRIRIDGILHDEFKISNVLHKQIIAVLKIQTHMRTDEHRAPQDGRYEFASALGGVDVRASIIPVTGGEKAVLRLLSAQSHQLSLEDLGFAEEDLKRIRAAINKPWGMILATGPTGSGKTTTVYAILEILNTREVNVATIEDPVEFDIVGVNQSQVDHAAKLTFANGLRAILRQDPDIVMVGEIRDEETAKIAVNAALTGHKLLSTLHTNNSASTIPRMIDMSVEPFLISSTLICAIAQRLVRRVCPDCGEKKNVDRSEFEGKVNEILLGLLFDKKKAIEVTAAKGCAKCNNTGYKGRVGIYEVLQNSKAIQELIVQRADSERIQEQARKEGMTTIVEDGVRKIMTGQTTIEELIRVMQE